MWRLVDGKIRPMLLTSAGRYKSVARSKAFPLLDMEQFNHFLHMALTQNQHAPLKAFREWIRQSHKR